MPYQTDQLTFRIVLKEKQPPNRQVYYFLTPDKTFDARRFDNAIVDVALFPGENMTTKWVVGECHAMLSTHNEITYTQVLITYVMKQFYINQYWNRYHINDLQIISDQLKKEIDKTKNQFEKIILIDLMDGMISYIYSIHSKRSKSESDS